MTHEPQLPMADIQGIAVPGFLKPHQTLIGVECGDKHVAHFKTLLAELAPEIATAAQTLDDRRRHRRKQQSSPRAPLVAVAFTHAGLRKLTPGADAIASPAFQQGLAARSALLGDPTDPKHEGSPARWVVGGPDKQLDALFVVAGDTRKSVDERARSVEQRLRKGGLKIAYVEAGDVRGDLPGHEHFGFDDGISQPGIRGRASADPNDFITERYIAASQQPDHQLFGYPGQDLVWPGAFVLGQPGTSPDPLVPGQLAAVAPGWAANGSFLVFRRLRQDVALFWRTMKEEATRLAQLPGFAGMTDEKLASRIVGRWPSGAPVNRVPDADDEKLGAEPLANNHIRFDSDAVAPALRKAFKDTFPQSKADPAGITCPWAAHIRKVNTRDSGSDVGGREATYARRLLRVGVPFGPPLKNRYDGRNDPARGNRGLLFLSIQASIEDQFEFLVTRWMGDPSRPKMPGGHDLFVGQNDAPGEDRIRRCVMFGSGVEATSVTTDAQWIVATGGGYFFVPSLPSLRDVIAA